MTLPVFEIEGALRDAVRGERARVLLKAPTGSGKSTSVPGMLVDAGISGRIIVIEPRRMAARLLAGWVAKQRKATLGNEVGYAVRFDTKYRADTRIIYMTDGVFQRWIQDDPELTGVGAVVFDEFHERRLAVDIALARCHNGVNSSPASATGAITNPRSSRCASTSRTITSVVSETITSSMFG